LYYYRSWASNATGVAWAPASTNFRTATIAEALTNIQDGMVGWWPGDGHFLDLTTNHNDGASGGSVGFLAGKVAEAFSFDGTAGAVVNVPTNASLNFTEAVTLAAWVKHNALGGAIQRYIVHGIEKAQLRFDPTRGGFDFLVRTPGTYHYLAAGIMPQTNRYYLVVGTYDGTTQRFYVDGDLVASQAVSGPIEELAPSSVGLFLSLSTEPMDGLVDEAMLFRRALTADEVAALYAAGSDGAPKRLQILAPPTNAVATVGAGNEPMKVLASGTGSLTYQWRWNGTNRVGETGATLDLAGLTVSDVGVWDVDVVVGDASGGSVTSTPLATLDVRMPAGLPTDGLIGWWPANGDFRDRTTNHHDGVGVNGIGFVTGRLDQAFSLNGLDQCVELGTWFAHPAFTISLWVNAGPSQVTYANLIDNNHTGSRSWAVEGNDSPDTTKSYFHWGWGQSGIDSVYFGLTRGSWQHLALLFDSNHVGRAYLDGTLMGTVAGSGPVNYDGSQFLRLGQWGGGGRNFNGAIDEVTIYNRSLSPDEIWRLSGGTAPLVDNADGASNVTATSATLCGNLISTGTAATAVAIYWGTADGGTNPLSWGSSFQCPMSSPGPFSINATALTPGASYWYRCWASNGAGVAWAPASTNFATRGLPDVPSNTHYVAVANLAPAFPFTTWDTAANTIQDAVDAAVDGDTVLVSNGVYRTGGRAWGELTNRVTVSSAITVRSVNGPALTVIEGSGPQGEQAVRCWAAPAGGAWLCGFTLTNGFTTTNGNPYVMGSGAGAWGGTVSNCIAAGNTALLEGGGLYNVIVYDSVVKGNLAGWGGGVSRATLFRSRIDGNSVSFDGGGVYLSTLTDCLLASNSAAYDGGGGDSCTFSNCVVVGNSGNWGGGALDSVLVGCVVDGNTANCGGGTWGGSSRNCLVVRNISPLGGGAYGGSLANCTLTGNSSGRGGGATDSALTNCIVWLNTASTESNVANCVVSYSCTTPDPGGAGNITADPLFIDPANGNFHLQSASPCLDMGTDEAWMTGAVDLDGNPRIQGLAVDIGAYEHAAVLGYIQCLLLPGAATGAQWRIASGADTNWHGSGQVSAPLAPAAGPYTVTFLAVGGWTTPADIGGIAVSGGGTATVSAVYVPTAMVQIPGGTFQMGVYQGQGGHTVTLSGFLLDRRPVTVGDYQAFCADTGNTMPAPPTWGWTNTSLPMVNVTWNEAAAYAAWAGKRLPTEAEYEYAMRDTLTNRLYPWGDTISPANANYAGIVGRPTVAGTYPPTPNYGLSDIAGNVWEWCNDWYIDVLTGPVTNPAGPASGTVKTVRGGSWVNSAVKLRCAGRYQMQPFVRYVDLGFRCAMDIKGAAAPANGNDWWWQMYFGTVGAARDPNLDSDGDGMADGLEFVAGTDPTNPASCLGIESIRAGAGGAWVGWKGGTVSTQYLEAGNLGAGPWRVIFTNLPPTATSTNYLDTAAATNRVQFYRIKAWR
jgi:formylglycine-generating enzyme required for sulfatase activity